MYSFCASSLDAYVWSKGPLRLLPSSENKKKRNKNNEKNAVFLKFSVGDNLPMFASGM